MDERSKYDYTAQALRGSPRQTAAHEGPAQSSSGGIVKASASTEVTHATVAAYFHVGVATGLLDFERAKVWAFGVIEALDDPPIEIIEVAMSGDHASALQNLGLVPGNADRALAGRWLLGVVLERLKASSFSAMEAARAAMRVVDVSGLPREIWYDFDCLDDELQLAMNGQYSNCEAVSRDVQEALSRYSSRSDDIESINEAGPAP